MIKKDDWKLIWTMGLDAFKMKYSGAAFGTVWAFVQPVVTILLYWIVFQFGIKSQSVYTDIPFVIWMMSALIPYLFLVEAINECMNSFISYSYLVKKVIFNIKILPIVKLIASLFVHVAFMLFLFMLCMILGVKPSPFLLQLPCYTLFLLLYIISVSYFLASVVVFFRDLSQIVGIILQIGMWATPIFWAITKESMIQTILSFNPLYFITEGYRDCVVGNPVLFYEKPAQLICFLGIVCVNFMVSKYVYTGLKDQFAEVL